MNAFNSRKFKWLAFIIVDLLLAVVIVGLLFIREERQETLILSDLGVSLFPQSKIIEPFSLTDQKGAAFTEAGLQGQWSLIFFGFSNCPNVCPLTLRELAAAQAQLLASRSEPVPQVIFATVDPARDDPARLRRYLDGFPGELVGLTGADAELAKLAAQLYVVASKSSGHGDESTHASHASSGDNEDQAGFDHSGHVSVINPAGELVAAVALPHRAENIIAALSRLDSQ